MSKWITVKDMFKYAQDNNLMLLSGYQADFWDEYRQNNDRFDSLFKTLFKNYRYFDQDIYDEDNTVENVTNEFIYQVQNFLMINRKKYDELFRVNSLTNQEYNLLDNINYTETRVGDIDETRNLTEGARQDSDSSTLGQRQDMSTTQVSAYNSSEFANSDRTTDTRGSQTDTSSYSKGSQLNTDVTDRQENLTITRKGKISGDSIAETIKQHIELWDIYEFYGYIFNDIATQFLLV